MAVHPPHFPYNTLIKTYRSWGRDPGLEACLKGRSPRGFGPAVRLVLGLKKLEIHGLAGDFEQGIRLGEEAVAQARNAGLSLGQAMALLFLSEVYAGKSEFDKMNAAAQQALDLFSSQGNLVGQAKALNNLGNAYDNLGDLEKARAYYEQSLGIFEALNDKSGCASSLNNLSTLYVYEGDTERALELTQRALSIVEEAGDLYGQAYCLITLGVIHGRTGNLALALDFQRRALALQEKVGDHFAQAVALNNIAFLEAGLGNYPRAMSYYEQAYRLRTALGDRTGSSQVLSNIGKAYAALGDFEKAVDFQERALVIRRETGERRYQALSLIYLVQDSLEKSDLARAQAALGEAQVLTRDGLLDNDLLCRQSQAAAALALELRDFQAADQEIESGLLLAESLSSRRYRSALLLLRAQLKDARGEWSGSQADYEETVKILGSLGEKADLAKASYLYGRALLAHGEEEKGRWYLGEARRLFESIGAEGWLARMEAF